MHLVIQSQVPSKTGMQSGKTSIPKALVERIGYAGPCKIGGMWLPNIRDKRVWHHGVKIARTAASHLD